MDVPAAGQDVLRQETRARIFAWLAERRSPAATEQIAAGLDLHPNGVRRHLERMGDAGLLERTRSTGSRGRPGDLWAIAPTADPGGKSPTGYVDLARWLARAIPPGRNRLREVERAGREIGAEVAPAETVEDPLETFRHTFASLGFRPELEVGDGDFTCRLENCPYRESVRENQAIVCALHRGITDGLLEKTMPGAKLDRFEPHDPDVAGCVVAVSGLPGGVEG